MARDITQNRERHVILVINGFGGICCLKYGTACDFYWLDWYKHEMADWQVWWIIRETIGWHELYWWFQGWFLYWRHGWSQRSSTWGWVQHPKQWTIWGNDGRRASWLWGHLQCDLQQICRHWSNNGRAMKRPKEGNSMTSYWRIGWRKNGDLSS